MGVRLRPVREDELTDWLAASRSEYERALVADGGLTEEGAARKATRDLASVFPDGRPAPEHTLFVVADEETGEAIGRAWLAVREGADGPHAFVYEVYLDSGFRGRGDGRRTMEALEEEARRGGHTRMRLNVFGGNAVARALYRSLGYEELAVTMGKDLT